MLNFTNIKNTTQNSFKSNVVAYDRRDNTFPTELDKYFDPTSWAQMASSVKKLRTNGENDQVIIKADPSIPQNTEVTIQVHKDNIVKSVQCLPQNIVAGYNLLRDKIKEQLNSGKDTGCNTDEKREQGQRIISLSNRVRNASVEITNPEVFQQSFDVDTLRRALDQLMDIRLQARSNNNKVTCWAEKNLAGENAIRLKVVDKASQTYEEASSKPLELIQTYQQLCQQLQDA